MARNKIDYYNVLGIDTSADVDIIRNAYRVLAKKYHPDTCQILSKKEAEEKIKLINEAYDVLSDPEKREIYDNQLFSSQKKQSSSNESPINKRKNSGSSSGSYNFDAFGVNKNNYNYAPDAIKQMISKMAIIFKIGAVIIVTIALIVIGVITDRAPQKKVEQTYSVQKTKEPIQQKNEYFTLGSSKLKVQTIMGAPDEKNEFSYGYGDSSVFFNQKGLVLGWNNVNNRLKVFIALPDKNQPPIKVGTTKLEVVKVMGTPTFLSKSQWRYEKSSIFFDALGKVKRWDNVSNNLRIK